MIFNINILKKFDGINNYFNPSYYEGNVILRKESKYKNKILVSDIIDIKGTPILTHNIDVNYLYSYEDARLISRNEFGVCVCKRDINDLIKIVNVEYKRYNIEKKEFTSFKTQNLHFEKHWQFYKNYIIYHINPYTIYNENETLLIKKNINWKPWIEKYGKPGLSTNIFEVNNKKYLLFHSYTKEGQDYYKYYVGILYLNDVFNPIGYSINPILESDRNYSDNVLLNSMWNWRKTELCDTVKYEVIFPMSVNVDEKYVNIYSGMNDCSAVCLQIQIDKFIEEVSNIPFILI